MKLLRIWCWMLGVKREGAFGHDPKAVIAMHHGVDSKWDWQCTRCHVGYNYAAKRVTVVR